MKSGRIGGAYRRKWSNEQEACYRGRDRFDATQDRERWEEETVVMRIPRSRVSQVMALLTAPTELI